MSQRLSSAAVPFVLWSLVLCASLGFQLDTKVRVHGHASIAVPPTPSVDSDGDDEPTSLTAYMRLPVDQYVLVPMPLNSKLTRNDNNSSSNNNNTAVDGNEFLLQVPPLQFLDVLRVRPLVTAHVVLRPDRVLITSQTCRLESPDDAADDDSDSYIQRVRLNERFAFDVSCTLTWTDDHERDDDRRDGSSSTSSSKSRQPQQSQQQQRKIHAETEIRVNVDPPPPFSRLPKAVLTATGNAAMRISVRYLVQSFLKGLVQDYTAWATEAEYRRRRREDLSQLTTTTTTTGNSTSVVA